MNLKRIRTIPQTNSNADKDEILVPYFKLETAGSACSLILSSGVGYADGIYVQKGESRVLQPSGDFQYVFFCNKVVGYQYSKCESNPMPGYEFKDGQEFEDGQMFYLNDDVLASYGGQKYNWFLAAGCKSLAPFL